MGRGHVTTLLFLPDGRTDDADFRWLRVGEDAVRGEGLPLDGDPVIAVAPADAVTLHWAELPSRSLAQATAAARLLATEASAAPPAQLHVAVGAAEEGAPERPIGVVDTDAMARWLAMLARAGIDPVAVVPAPMLLPRPEEGYVRAEIGGRGVVRGRTSGFAGEARITELITGGTPPAELDRGALDAALSVAVAAPTLDLRQGPFARRRRFAVDWRLVRRLANLLLAILAVTFAISLVRLARYSFAADTTEARADALAASGLPRGETVTDADRQLAERLGRIRGPGLGFTTTAAAAFAVIRAVPGTEVTGVEFSANGELRLTVAVEREALATDLKRALERSGFVVRASTFAAAGGRITGDLTVVPQ